MCGFKKPENLCLGTYTYVSFREYSDPLQQLRGYLSQQQLVPVEGKGLGKFSQDTPLLQLLQFFKATQDTHLVVIFDNVSPSLRRTFIEALKQWSLLQKIKPPACGMHKAASFFRPFLKNNRILDINILMLMPHSVPTEKAWPQY
ncbi:MAG: hypothetical protein DRR19_03900 [Candidatus Parabeggiatoa sp. nov. 1]|nr:MAG: hypothetical protein DRR19_03900 [Gammaproteobacteria bacterium]